MVNISFQCELATFETENPHAPKNNNKDVTCRRSTLRGATSHIGRLRGSQWRSEPLIAWSWILLGRGVDLAEGLSEDAQLS